MTALKEIILGQYLLIILLRQNAFTSLVNELVLRPTLLSPDYFKSSSD